MSEKHKYKEINEKELQALISRVEHAISHDLSLTVEDLKLLLAAINTLCTLRHSLQDKNATLTRLRKLLGMLKQSEKRQSKEAPDDKQDKAEHAGDGDGQNPKEEKKTKKRKPKKRRSPNTTPATTITVHSMTEFNKGDVCPECRCGKLYKHTPSELLRITGNMPFAFEKHIAERMRCNACQVIFPTKLPPEVLADGEPNQKYGYSARTVMAVSKFYSGSPYYHQGNLADLFGQTISASTIFDQCERLANDIMPLFYCLRQTAAQAGLFLIDDTHHKILQQQPQMRQRRNGKGLVERTGVYSSGLIAMLDGGQQVALIETSLGHAGEHLDGILQKRQPGLPTPLLMRDALSSNNSLYPVIDSFCNAHARRYFVDAEDLYPEPCAWLIDQYRTIWQTEDACQEQRLTPAQRLLHHQQHSLPAMEKILAWVAAYQQSEDFEQHDALGKACAYFTKHYHNLTAFCRHQNALLDNNRLEQMLKTPIRSRKLSHFYQTANGAGVANVITSVILTAEKAELNIFQYLLALQQNKPSLKADPIPWLPWNYLKQSTDNS